VHLAEEPEAAAAEEEEEELPKEAMPEELRGEATKIWAALKESEAGADATKVVSPEAAATTQHMRYKVTFFNLQSRSCLILNSHHGASDLVWDFLNNICIILESSWI